MAERGKQGFWVQVPEGNGYSRASFNQRVVPHLQQLGLGVFVPAWQKLHDVKMEGGKKVEEVVEAGDRSFGVVLEASGQWWDEVYRKLGFAEGALRVHYGLEVSGVEVRYGQNYEVEFTREPKEDPETREGREGEGKI